MTGKLFCKSAETEITENLKRINENILRAKLKAGRSSSPGQDVVRIMAVTKTIEPATVNAAIGCGIDLLGENRVQEFLRKRDDYSPCEIHFIGGLQTNKVRQIIKTGEGGHPWVSVIQSVDSERLAKEIDKQGVATDVLIQVNIGGESTKGGVAGEGVRELAEQIGRLSNLRLRGLMTIPPFEGGERYFPQMQRLYEDLRAEYSGVDTLSMGMSGDYSEAVEHGATVIRLGTALFGIRRRV